MLHLGTCVVVFVIFVVVAFHRPFMIPFTFYYLTWVLGVVVVVFIFVKFWIQVAPFLFF